MQLNDFLALLERSAPLALAEEWDNPGLLIEPEGDEISRVLFALDCTLEVAREAKECGAQLVITHHPLFFKPVRRISRTAPDTAAAYMLIRNGIGLFAAHTNLDSVTGGVNDALAQAVGLVSVHALHLPDVPLDDDTQGIGRVGELPVPLTLEGFAQVVQSSLSASVRYGGAPERIVRRVAVVGGSGGDFIPQAKAAGADVLLTGEVKHSHALDAAALGLGLVEAGHCETERVVLAPWIAGLQSALDTLQYKVDLLTAKSERAPLVAP